MPNIFSWKKLIAFIIFIMGLLLFLSATTLGLQTIVSITKRLIPGDLQIKTVRGRLNSDISLENLSYRNNNIQINIKYLHLSWDAAHLLNKKIFINNLVIDNIAINQRSQNTELNKFSLDSFFWTKYLIVKNIIINNINYSNQTKLIQLNELTIKRNADINNNLMIISPYGNIKGLVNISFYPFITWTLILNGENLNPRKIFSEWNGLINIKLKSQGQWGNNNKTFQIDLENLQGQLKNLPVYGTANIVYQNGNLEINKTKITVLNGVVNIEGKLTESFAIHWQATMPKLNLVSAKMDGNISTSGEITGSRTNPQIYADIKILHSRFDNLKIQEIVGKVDSTLASNQLNLNLTGSNIEFAKYAIPHINLNTKFQISKERLFGYSSIFLANGNKLIINFNLPTLNKMNDFSQSVNAKINFDFNQLASLLKTPEIKDMKGRVSGFVDIAGNFSKLLVKSMAQLNNGYAYIPKAHIKIDAITFKAEYQSHSPVNLKGQFHLGSGLGIVNGTVDLEKPELPVALTVDGDGLQLQKNNTYKITFSPHLKILYAKQKLNMQGKITVPSAEITSQDFSQVTTLPSEVIIVGKKKADQFNLPNMTTNIALNLNNIKLIYQNLDAMLDGSLIISQTPNSLPVGVGALNILEGSYKIYGRKLTINYGRLIYAGNVLTDPGLDIKATQKFDTVSFAEDQNQFNNNKRLTPIYAGTTKLIVGVTVRGNLSRPKLTFFSDPANLNQTDILSYLAFGVPRSQISGANSIALLNSLATSPNQNSTNFSVDKVTQKIENTFNLSELSLGSTEVYDPNKNITSQATTVNIGRQLGKKLSVRYKAGVFTPISILNLQYKFNKHFSIQTETSSLESGADLLYEIEVD